MRTEFVLALLLVVGLESINSEGHPPEEFFTFTLNDIKGQPVNFDQFKGKVTLMALSTTGLSITKHTKLLYCICINGILAVSFSACTRLHFWSTQPLSVLKPSRSSNPSNDSTTSCHTAIDSTSLRFPVMNLTNRSPGTEWRSRSTTAATLRLSL